MISLGKLNANSKEILLKEMPNGCIECVSHTKDTCGYTRIRYNGKHERLFRVVFQMKYGKIPKGMLIRHKCDNPSCCNIDHLEIGTPKENVSDMIERGRSKIHSPKPKLQGIKNFSNKLTEEQVKDVYLSKLSSYKLAKEYGVSKTTILLIKHKKMWSWLTNELD